MNNKFCLVYILNRESILVSYDLINKQIINKNFVNKNNYRYRITDVRHHLDKKLKRDIILHNNMYNNEVYAWDFKNWQKLTQINEVNKRGALYSSSLIILYIF